MTKNERNETVLVASMQTETIFETEDEGDLFTFIAQTYAALVAYDEKDAGGSDSVERILKGIRREDILFASEILKHDLETIPNSRNSLEKAIVVFRNGLALYRDAAEMEKEIFEEIERGETEEDARSWQVADPDFFDRMEAAVKIWFSNAGMTVDPRKPLEDMADSIRHQWETSERKNRARKETQLESQRIARIEDFIQHGRLTCSPA